MMKYLLIVAVVWLVIWRVRSSRNTNKAEKARQAPPAGPQEMVRCEQCGVHLPAADALIGPRGNYCSLAHRQAHLG
jgi:uncharacterized protein